MTQHTNYNTKNNNANQKISSINKPIIYNAAPKTNLNNRNARMELDISPKKKKKKKSSSSGSSCSHNSNQADFNNDINNSFQNYY